MGLILRNDLEAWPCSSCQKGVFSGETIQYRFYCRDCVPLDGEPGESTDDEYRDEGSLPSEALLSGQTSIISESENSEVVFLADKIK